MSEFKSNIYTFKYKTIFVFSAMTEREVPDGALPLRQGVRSVEAGLGVPDSRQCQGHLCAPSVVLPSSLPESTCCGGCQCQVD